MNELPKFSERLTELMFYDDNLPNYKFGQKLGISPNAISQWKTGKACPTFPMFVRLADHFGCSLDYLSGRTNDDDKYTPNNNLPPFPKRLMDVLKERGITWYKVVKDTHINDSNMRNWRRGSLPLVPMLVELADYIDVSIDYLVGRDL
ncbi:MAG: transcriptional regulator [Firmicutes bacterium]|nr:transcriptional regulator [Bacillota bacterium]